MSYARPLEVWLTRILSELCFMIINSLILRKEWMTRKKDNIIFVSYSMEISSLFVIICGVIRGLFGFTRYIPGFCYFSIELQVVMIAAQNIFMGFFQLSRLYYCFSETNVYSRAGYSNRLFYAMYTIGTFLLIIAVILSFCSSIPYNCFINSKSNYRYQENDIMVLEWSMAQLLYNICISIAFAWDLTNLTLYLLKLVFFRKLKSDKMAVYIRIKGILSKIIKLTVFYQSSVIILLIIGICKLILGDSDFMEITWWFLWGIQSIIMSYSMFLMQQHNEQYYRQFLQVLHLRVCCWCCIEDIETHLQLSAQQINSNSNSGSLSMNQTVNNQAQNIEMAPTQMVNNNRSIYDTRDLSFNSNNLPGIIGLQFSAPTDDIVNTPS